MRFTTNPSFSPTTNPFARLDDEFDDDWLLLSLNQQVQAQTPPVRSDIDYRDDQIFQMVQLNLEQPSNHPIVHQDNPQLQVVRRINQRRQSDNLRNRRLNLANRRQAGNTTNVPKKPRKRNCDNSVGYTIAAIKKIEKTLKFNEIEGEDSEEVIQILNCIDDLRKTIRKLKSSNGSLRDARIVINPNDEQLIKEIQSKVRKSKIEKMFEAILRSHDYDIIEKSKDVIRDALGTSMNPTWIEQFAYQVDFRQQSGQKTVEEKQRDFHMYLSYFKFCLSRNGIATTLKRKEFNEFKERQAI